MNVKSWAVTLGFLAATSAHAASYDFDVEYFGGGVATLAAGSDDPTLTTLVSGDDFNWTITAQNDGQWTVLTGGGFFPLMAFVVPEAGVRIGDFTLTLRNDGGEVFSVSETGSEQRFVHLGTNTVLLGTGLAFDRMELNYSLTLAAEDSDDIPYDPLDPVMIGSSPGGLLPIFGAPEMNSFSPGIIYGPVPEPGAGLLMLAGLAGLGWAARRRSHR